MSEELATAIGLIGAVTGTLSLLQIMKMKKKINRAFKNVLEMFRDIKRNMVLTPTGAAPIRTEVVPQTQGSPMQSTPIHAPSPATMQIVTETAPIEVDLPFESARKKKHDDADAGAALDEAIEALKSLKKLVN